MKIATIGNGFIASELEYPILPDKLRVHPEEIEDFVSNSDFDVLVNCIGFCGKNTIDDCEGQKERLFNTNTILPIMLAASCERHSKRLIHISSGCIFNGDSPNIISTTQFCTDAGWNEKNYATPLSSYSKSKYASDLVLQESPITTILRIRMPISSSKSPRNLLSKLIRYSLVVEAQNSITLTQDLSMATRWVIDNDKVGVYHITSPKPFLHSEILNEYKKYKPDHNFTSISQNQLGEIVMVPRSNCILDSSKAIKEGFVFLNEEQAVKDCVRKFANE